MGGRGSSFGPQSIDVMGGAEEGIARPLNVAGMTAMEEGSRNTSVEKTLDFIEEKKINYPTEQVQIIDQYGYVTHAYQGDKGCCAIDRKGVEACRGATVTHNHPSDYGGTFSHADIRTLAAGAKEFRASAKEGTYIIRAGSKANPVQMERSYSRAADQIQEKIDKIAIKNAAKKWTSRKAYEYQNRKEQCNVIHEWYANNAEKFGYTYEFHQRIPGEGSSILPAQGMTNFRRENYSMTIMENGKPKKKILSGGYRFQADNREYGVIKKENEGKDQYQITDIRTGLTVAHGETAHECMDIIKSKEIQSLLADPKYEGKLNKLEQKMKESEKNG